MQKITPHLWYDKEAKEAAEFYLSVFKEGRVKSSETLNGTPSGDVDVLSLELFGLEFSLISAGPYFKFTPAISFLVACKSKEEVDEYWSKLSVGGMALMELGAYPFSERYGWLQDKFGLNWQLMYMGEKPVTERIIPTLMFVGDVCGKAEEAMHLYISLFENSKVDHVMRYEAGEEPDKAGTVRHAGFTLDGHEFAAMDSAHKHEFTFNEAVSFVVNCETQEEIDYFWSKLSAAPQAEQCGWLKDKFGVSWQVVPTAMAQMMAEGSAQQKARVTEAFLKMKKFDLAELQKAFNS